MARVEHKDVLVSVDAEDLLRRQQAPADVYGRGGVVVLDGFVIPRQDCVGESHAGANDGDYSNPAFDALLEKGNAEKDLAAANADYQAAQELLLKDLPVIPLWYSNVTGGYAEGVQNVEFGWNSVPLYYLITK